MDLSSSQTGTRPRRAPTIKDVAAVAGVSRGTVSRVLNGGHWVSPEALVAVNEAIRVTGYHANKHARSLVTGRSNSVAFLLTEPQHMLFEQPIFSILLRGSTRALAELGMPMLLMVAGDEGERRRIVDYVAAGHVDGVLVVSSHASSPVIDSLLSKGVPTVACGAPLGFEGRVGYVEADEIDGSRAMVRHLLERGRRRIATITGPLDTAGGVKRLEGYRRELGDLFDPALVVHGDYTREGGRHAMQALLDRDLDLDAVFAASDLTAAGALAVLTAHGYRVPQDVAVGGFDDAGLAASLHPALTTIRQPFERISREMVRLLLDVIDGGPPAAITLPPTLVVRSST
ncbi:LacI family DNA-binding transcriptional regulator [Cellulomonas sp. KRMCY2]|uniref:LacI family DNA-binding transcriptional regulator n=1 Tax=Cellulomonas sp. KRMCY2 TaxID=1304865 RepID=UPI00045E6621|nr:LacI family DNA-binding transcriptional regulator [Cellulomonas sp. KRMCY2]